MAAAVGVLLVASAVMVLHLPLRLRRLLFLAELVAKEKPTEAAVQTPGKQPRSGWFRTGKWLRERAWYYLRLIS